MLDSTIVVLLLVAAAALALLPGRGDKIIAGAVFAQLGLHTEGDIITR